MTKLERSEVLLFACIAGAVLVVVGGLIHIPRHLYEMCSGRKCLVKKMTEEQKN